MHIWRFVRILTMGRHRIAFAAACMTGGLNMTACVIPIGPQSDDAEPNFPPFVETSDPGVGEIFSPTQDGSPFVTVTLGDQNLGDTLFLRWLLDYPSAEPDGGQVLMEVEPAPTGKVDRGPVRYVPTCPKPSSSPTLHRLVLSVSDRRFLDETKGESVSRDAPKDSPQVGANRMRAVWLLNCP